MTDRQRQYYTETAGRYDELHAEESPHDEAAAIICSLAKQHAATSLLDVGSGTGYRLAQFRELLPNVRVQGIEPVPALIDVARAKHGFSEVDLRVGDANHLPFESKSIDFVVETGMLHHVADPSAVVREMIRVARRGVFLSDSNRFGQGSPRQRIAKLALAASGLWSPYYYLRTRGRRYEESEGDGVYYSFSVYDVLPELQAWTSDVWVRPLDGNATPLLSRWTGPLLNSSHCFVGAVKA